MQAEKADKTKTAATGNGTAKPVDTPDEAPVAESAKPEPVQEAVPAENIPVPVGPGVTSVAAHAADLVTGAARDLSSDRYTLVPKGTWPPPIYVDPSASEQERHYIEHRWHAQWDWYDKRASNAKNVYQRLQIIIGVGSVTVPVLIGFTPSSTDVREILQVATVALSLTVAIAAAIENVKKYGDNWRNFRGAAEELLREKALYDVRSGPYRKTKTPFLLFVQRCEEIMTKQNGSFLQLAEDVQQGQQAQGGNNPGKTEDNIGG
ncbi:MAG TPA: DUF4231 domain-containing protein [Phototrophicaceae bacterium]|jgi:hypothetical protein|nr:DUF4231 domain-containing protein [Phototrophicaceae bacterium]